MRGISTPETIAAHSHGATLVALALGPRVSPPIDVDRAVALLAIHDVPEALLSDLPQPATHLFPDGAKHAAEDRAAAQLLPALSETAVERYAEFQGGTTREARFARLCDRLHMGVALVDYLRAGHRGLDDFVQTLSALECDEFAPCEELRREIVAAAETR